MTYESELAVSPTNEDGDETTVLRQHDANSFPERNTLFSQGKK